MFDKDMENGFDKHRVPSYNSGSIREPNYEATIEIQGGYRVRVFDSFKRDPRLNITPNGVIGSDGHVFQSDAAAKNTAESPLARKLKGRHLQMIAIGGSIGKLRVRRAIEHS